MDGACLDAARWLAASALLAAAVLVGLAEVQERRWLRRCLDDGLADLDDRLAEYRRRLHARQGAAGPD